MTDEIGEFPAKPLFWSLKQVVWPEKTCELATKLGETTYFADLTGNFADLVGRLFPTLSSLSVESHKPNFKRRSTLLSVVFYWPQSTVFRRTNAEGFFLWSFNVAKKTKLRTTVAYRNGRFACLNGLTVADNPHRSTGRVSGNRRRMEWFEGYYDQLFGKKWEPNDAQIKKRVWPVHV